MPLPTSCDQCETYHRLGYDRCPACIGAEDVPAIPPAPPAVLIWDVEEQMRQHLLSQERPDALTLHIWIVMLSQARHRLDER